MEPRAQIMFGKILSWAPWVPLFFDRDPNYFWKDIVSGPLGATFWAEAKSGASGRNLVPLSGTGTRHKGSGARGQGQGVRDKGPWSSDKGPRARGQEPAARPPSRPPRGPMLSPESTGNPLVETMGNLGIGLVSTRCFASIASIRCSIRCFHQWLPPVASTCCFHPLLPPHDSTRAFHQLPVRKHVVCSHLGAQGPNP